MERVGRRRDGGGGGKEKMLKQRLGWAWTGQDWTGLQGGLDWIGLCGGLVRHGYGPGMRIPNVPVFPRLYCSVFRAGRRRAGV
jgi:hypothetical protein